MYAGLSQHVNWHLFPMRSNKDTNSLLLNDEDGTPNKASALRRTLRTLLYCSIVSAREGI